jgi:tRNA(fMet)-specific endonuclease VapC
MIKHQLKTATWVGISVISELEFLAFSGLTANDVRLFQTFKSRVHVIDLQTAESNLIQTILLLRQSFNIKLPDGIVAASAIEHQATLISNDAIFLRVTPLSLMTF